MSCKGDACDFVELRAEKNQEGHIESIEVSNVKSKPVKIQVEFNNALGYSQEPWSRYKLGANDTKTFSVDTSMEFIGAKIKRANIIVD